MSAPAKHTGGRRRGCLALLAGLLGGACHVGYDFRGPGFDADSGKVRPDVPEHVVVAVTSGEIASGSSAAFFTEVEAVMKDLDARDGLVGFALRKQTFGRRIWTLSAWTDEASLEAFLREPAHRRAVRNGGIPPSTVRQALVIVPATRLPLSWAEALALLPAEPQ